ncbi:helix-turn-helix domain-containing protein [Klebsiella pneumoniae]|uniref:helix-turn-helix domain-containing protein n=1 Tax=Enterobacteriaceae TaxID=543 RepID=UPI000B8CF821|nr:MULTISPECIES: helix-turn-helix domain-containing protein [Enterobacteriaceae]EJC4711070.1 helix-turn-helix domain-containing protein [Salmonella enterica]EFB3694881.1 helix-turn-helix domain-containing protein [Escherichia coli]ELO5119890.1 helix-turn-helix domain-containing protein [Escherichia coli]MBY2953598.1 helix-turn-helix domain-containing protein [Escherichia coli]MCP0938033.1 helix-turn-helix domain-containing protein [Klebsiella pneumoniae]
MNIVTSDNESNDDVTVSGSPAKAKPSRVADEKWGKEVMKAGFCIIPSLLLRCQQRLGLNPSQLAVLLQLADFWWEAGRKPYPSKQTLSDRLGLSTRQIQRYMAELEQAGLLVRIVRSADDNGKLSNEYDLSGLVKKLRELAPEVLKAKEDTKQVTRKGGLKK